LSIQASVFEAPGQDPIAHDERGVLAIETVPVRGVAELDDEQVLQPMAEEEGVSDRALHFARRPEQGRDRPRVQRLGPEEDRVAKPREVSSRPHRAEIVAARPRELREEIEPPEAANRMIQETKALDPREPTVELPEKPEHSGAQPLEPGQHVGPAVERVPLGKVLVSNDAEAVGDVASGVRPIVVDREIVAGRQDEMDHGRARPLMPPPSRRSGLPRRARPEGTGSTVSGAWRRSCRR